MQYDSREQWLAAKAGSVSSTESPALFNMSPYLTAYELGVQKQAKAVVDIAENERMVWGRRLESAIAQGVADDYHVLIESCEFDYEPHPHVTGMGSSYDYMIVGVPQGDSEVTEFGALYEKHGPGILEIKNVDALVYKGWPQDEMPDHIEIQVQHQMEVSRHAWCVVAVFVGGNRTVFYVRMRDEVVGETIARKVEKFWADLDKDVLPPVVLPQDADIIIKLNQYAEPNKVLDAQGNVTIASLCTEYLAAGWVRKNAEDAQKSIKAQILKFIGDSERALTDGFRVHAAMRAPVEVAAHTRAGYRDFRITKVEARK
jgi:putative phage-type endonuclease